MKQVAIWFKNSKCSIWNKVTQFTTSREFIQFSTLEGFSYTFNLNIISGFAVGPSPINSEEV